MNRMKVTGLAILLLSAVASGQYLPFERPADAVDATDRTGGRVIGYDYGVPANRITVLKPTDGPRGDSPLEVDRRFNPRNVTTLGEWKKVRQDIRKAVLDYFGQMPSPDLPLDEKVEKEEDNGDYTFRLVSIQFGGGRRSRVGLLIPKGLPAPAPAIIVLDAWYKTEKMLERVAGVKPEPPPADLATRMAATQPGAGTRPSSQRAAGDRIEGIYSRTFGVHLVRHGLVVVAVDQWHETFGKSSRLNTAGASVHNISRVITYLQTQKDLVNPRQIGVFGHIYGAELAQFAAAVEDRIAAVCVSNSWMEPTANYSTDYWGPPFWATGYFFAEFARARERANPEMYCSARQANTNPLPFLTQELMALVAPVPILGVNCGMSGTPAGIECIRPVYKLYGTPEPVELITHKQDTNLPANVRDHVVDFFFRAACSMYPGKVPPATAEQILAELKSGDPARQLKAAWLAAWWRCRPAVPELAKLLTSQDIALRRAAAKALQRAGAVKELFAHVQHPDPVVRVAAVEAIYIHGADRDTWKALEKLQLDPDRWVKEAKWQCLQLDPYE